MRRSLRNQALTLTLANGYTRGIGFALHLLLARLMGAEALGVMELSHSVIMLAITPVTAGIPSAMSRLTAQRTGSEAMTVLHAGRRLVLQMAAVLCPVLLVLSPALAWLLGDLRAIPAILTSVPDILLLGLCAAYCGYCFGQDDVLSPSVNECVEQTVRFLLSLALLAALAGRSVALTAALPGIAESVAGVVVLVLFARKLRLPPMQPNREVQRELLQLAAPMTLSRLCLTGLRALTAVLLPVCLRRSGLSAAAATAQFGLLNGMALPLLMMPGIITGAMCTVVTPAVSRQEHQPLRLQRTVWSMTLSSGGIGLIAAVLLYALADFFATTLYATPELAPLLRIMCPLALIFSVHQVLIGIITGLGLQQKTLTGTIVSSIATLLCMAWLAPLPRLRLFGAVLAMLAGHLVRLIWCAAVLVKALTGRKEEIFAHDQNFFQKRG